MMLCSTTALVTLLAAIAQIAVASPLLTARTDTFAGLPVPPKTTFGTTKIHGMNQLSGASYSSMDNEIYEYIPDPANYVVKVFTFATDRNNEKDAMEEATILNHMKKMKAWGTSGSPVIVMNKVPGKPLESDPDWKAARGDPTKKKALVAKIAPKVAAVVLKICEEYGIHHDDIHDGNIMKNGDSYDLVDWGVYKLHIAKKCTSADLASITATITAKLGG